MGQIGFNRNHPGGGTQPGDIQQYQGAQWYNADQNPIIGGGWVSGRADLSYAVTAGVGLIQTADGAMVVTWGNGATALTTQPAVARTDVIYVDDTGQARVAAQGGVDESSVCVLDKRRLPAGASGTSSSTSNHDRRWALPYGGTLGWLYGYGELRGGVTVPTSETMVTGRLWVPTDRWVDIHVDHAIFHQSDPQDIGYVRYQLDLDGGLLHTFELPYHGGYLPEYFTMKMVHITAGEHTVRVRRTNRVGPDALFFGGGTEKLAGGFVGVEDKGVAV